MTDKKQALELNLDLNINPEAINRVMAEKILDSALGQELDKEIKAQLDRLSADWGRPIRAVVRGELEGMIRQLVQEEFRGKIRETLTNLLTDEVIAEICRDTITAIQEKIRSDRDRW